MELILVFLMFVVIVLLIVLLLRSTTKDPATAEKQDLESFRAEMRDNLAQVRGMVQTQISEFRSEVTSSVGSLRQDVGSRLDSTTTTMGQVQTKLGELSEAAKQIQEVGKDIASLQEILQPPKLRGGLGEILLERLLEQVLPQASYGLQHPFRDGKIVDAVICLREGQLVPVDSKFPLESFKRILEAEQEENKVQRRREFLRSVRQHIDRVAEYIRPDEGTLSFALMYVPAENVYYETIIKSEENESDLFSYAIQKHVTPVSPHSFYAYLGAIALGLKGLAIERSAEQVVEHLHRLSTDFETIRVDFNTLGTHLNHATNKHSEAQRRLDRFNDRLTALPQPEGLLQLQSELPQATT